ncbi:MAG: DNA ligase D [Beijerinckiaceae bacterium]|nr:DNA ligase D [Beijerinckiaceae bacterium]
MAARSRKSHADLARYEAKRDFSKTSEPGPSRTAKAASRFVVQHHWARREHYDFRLELDGVMKSWAVTRGPSANPKDKRLAVETEDHPLDYANFEGTIPKGQYGGGTVMIWDEGVWEPHDEHPAKAWADGVMKFALFGHRMHGDWTLIRMKRRNSEPAGRNNWLLIKERDAFVEDDDSLAGRFAKSVRTERDRNDIEADRPAKSAKVTLPAFIPPCLCELHEEPPEGAGWLHEIKYDGYRMQFALAGDTVRIATRAGHDWTSRFTALASDAEALGVAEAVIDGEIVVFDERGISNFAALVAALEKNAQSIVFMAFDLMRLDGKDLRDLPLLERKARLKRLLEAHPTRHLRYADHLEGDASAIYRKAIAGGAEGLVSKRATSRYRSGRDGSWIKVKAVGRDDFLIVGWIPSEKDRAFSALMLAIETDDGLHYVGRVGTGFSGKAQQRIMERLEPLSRNTASPALTNLLNVPRSARWAKPELRAEIAFGGWTADHQLRHARFLALRDAVPSRGDAMTDAKPGKTDAALDRLTHPERVLFPDIGLTKRDMAGYYLKIAPRMLPHLLDRPVSFVRAPDDITHELFFQRHALKGMQTGLEQVLSDSEGKPYVAIAGIDGLVTAAQFSVIELHGWSARVSKPDNPDRIIFDLDPDPSVSFETVKAAAREVKDILAAANLESFALISGGKGIHVIAPLNQSNDWDEIEAFTKGLAVKLATLSPKRYVAVMTKAKRKGRIFVDYLRNKASSTAIVPYSLRARAGAPIAMPITWSDLDDIKAANQFHIEDALAMKRDPWPAFFELEQRISKETLQLVEG